MVAVRITLQQLVVPAEWTIPRCQLKRVGSTSQPLSSLQKMRKKTPHLSARLECGTYGHSVLI